MDSAEFLVAYIVINLLDLLLLSCLVASWIWSWSRCLSLEPCFFGCHIVCLRIIQVGILLIIIDLPLIVPLLMKILLSLHFLVVSLHSLLFLGLQFSNSLFFNKILLSMHLLVLFVHVECFDLLLVFSLLSLKLSPIDFLRSFRVMDLLVMVVHIVIGLLNVITLFVNLRVCSTFCILVHMSLTLWLSASSRSG